ncbi:endocuticle structural glycoprotein SgAbd-2-like [Penaeus chinensis]|uniref:endocuticle structural glycoprotein SgAbd-2-like n=1 Tax=Penaeus chinensis TaxID=139456 RepID=UPI001FB7D658|nr:endocuticle structural glycoprotein SgAbd-2-like [Penaeus chinensis]
MNSRSQRHSAGRSSAMRAVVLAILVAVAIAAPQYGYPTPAPPTPAPTPGYTYQEPEQTYLVPGTRAEDGAEEPEAPVEVVPIVKDERVHNEDGSYTVDVETGNGIELAEAGTLSSNGTAIKTGQYSYTAPDGSVIEVKFVADENGFQVESDALPVAPEFPHEIPEFVLRQIEFAAEEDARAAAEAEAALKTAETPANLYEGPQ